MDSGKGSDKIGKNEVSGRRLTSALSRNLRELAARIGGSKNIRPRNGVLGNPMCAREIEYKLI